MAGFRRTPAIVHVVSVIKKIYSNFKCNCNWWVTCGPKKRTTPYNLTFNVYITCDAIIQVQIENNMICNTDTCVSLRRYNVFGQVYFPTRIDPIANDGTWTEMATTIWWMVFDYNIGVYPLNVCDLKSRAFYSNVWRSLNILFFKCVKFLSTFRTIPMGWVISTFDTRLIVSQFLNFIVLTIHLWLP